MDGGRGVGATGTGISVSDRTVATVVNQRRAMNLLRYRRRTCGLNNSRALVRKSRRTANPAVERMAPPVIAQLIAGRSSALAAAPAGAAVWCGCPHFRPGAGAWVGSGSLPPRSGCEPLRAPPARSHPGIRAASTAQSRRPLPETFKAGSVRWLRPAPPLPAGRPPPRSLRCSRRAGRGHGGCAARRPCAPVCRAHGSAGRSNWRDRVPVLFPSGPTHPRSGGRSTGGRRTTGAVGRCPLPSPAITRVGEGRPSRSSWS
jgi:hypothetical protein